jgi:hypothetical protein
MHHECAQLYSGHHLSSNRPTIFKLRHQFAARSLAILAALIWYFMRGRSRTTTPGATGSSGTSGTTTSHPKVFDNDKRK